MLVRTPVMLALVASFPSCLAARPDFEPPCPPMHLVICFLVFRGIVPAEVYHGRAFRAAIALWLLFLCSSSGPGVMTVRPIPPLGRAFLQPRAFARCWRFISAGDATAASRPTLTTTRVSVTLQQMASVVIVTRCLWDLVHRMRLRYPSNCFLARLVRLTIRPRHAQASFFWLWTR